MRITSLGQVLGLMVFLILLNACGSGGITTAAQPLYVYAVGFETINGLPKAVLWKDDVATILDSGNYGARAFAVAVVAGHVYIAGVEGTASGTNVAVLWVDGLPTVLTSSGASGSAGGVALLGSDVYVVGNETAYNSSFGSYVTVAQYWKNGTPIILNNGIQGTGSTSVIVNASATSIAINGTDLYIAGWVGQQTATAPNTYSDEPVVTYWKNGTATQLTSGLEYSETAGIAVENGQVYVSGALCATFSPDCATATLWTDGVAGSLTPGLLSFASGTAAVDGTIYASVNVTDTSGTTAFLATNGVAKAISSTNESAANCVFTSGTDVYVGGAEMDQAAYWKNGVLTYLSGATADSSIYALTVVPVS